MDWRAGRYVSKVVPRLNRRPYRERVCSRPGFTLLKNLWRVKEERERERERGRDEF